MNVLAITGILCLCMETPRVTSYHMTPSVTIDAFSSPQVFSPRSSKSWSSLYSAPREDDDLFKTRPASSTPLILPLEGESFDIVNPCTDFGFKRAFTNPTILIDFLNHAMNYQGERQISELSYMDKDLQSLDPSAGRDFKVDIVCKTLGDRYFLIEMQNDYMSDYADKAYIEFARFLANIDRVKIYDLSMEKRKKLRIGSTEVDAKDFWKNIDEICTLVLSNKRVLQ
jgi:hypothetical protein